MNIFENAARLAAAVMIVAVCMALPNPARAQSGGETADTSRQKWADCNAKAIEENVSPRRRKKFLSRCMAKSVNASEQGTDDERMACMGDAFRVCGSEIPNVERVTVCMKKNFRQLSPGCQAQFK